jgi:hypothetical protein
MTKPPSLETLVGTDIGILSRAIMPHEPIFTVRLHAVEVSGLWVESDDLTEVVLQGVGRTMLDATPLFFFPFHMIECVISGMDKPAISETIAE